MISTIVARGIFSKLEISLLPEVRNELALIRTEDNPLAKVEAKLKAIIDEFEQAYFDTVKAPTAKETE